MKPTTPSTILYLDTEFTSLSQSASLLSLALVGNTGESFYAEFTDYPKATITPWIQKNVLSNFILGKDAKPHLKGKHWVLRANRKKITKALIKFLKKFDSIQVWADHVSYDWVFFCELFGGALHLPKNLHYMPMDLPTVLNASGINPDIDREKFVGKRTIKKFPEMAQKKHNALYDAYLLRASVEQLSGKK